MNLDLILGAKYITPLYIPAVMQKVWSLASNVIHSATGLDQMVQSKVCGKGFAVHPGS
jgi:hypothetical protein